MGSDQAAYRERKRRTRVKMARNLGVERSVPVVLHKVRGPYGQDQEERDRRCWGTTRWALTGRGD